MYVRGYLQGSENGRVVTIDQQGVWENNTCKWSDLQYGDVYSYLTESPGTLPFFFINNL